jgi:hypothetical protein
MKYFKNRIKYDFSKEEKIILNEIYFLRNVIAHNSGFVRTTQRDRLPSSVAVENNEIQLSRSYLESRIDFVEKIVDRMDTYVIERWRVPKSIESFSSDIPAVTK